MATLTIAPRPAFDPKTATLQQVPGTEAWNAEQQRRVPKLNLRRPKIGLPPVSAAVAPRPLLPPPLNAGPQAQAPAPFPSTFSGPQQPMPSAPVMQAPAPAPSLPGAMSGPQGLGQRFAAALPKPPAAAGVPMRPPLAASAPLPASPSVAPPAAAPRPALGSGLLSKPFGTGMNNEQPMVPYQGKLGNGGAPADKGTVEDFVKRGLADASPHMAGRHLDRISTGRFKGKLKSQAVQQLEDEYAR